MTKRGSLLPTREIVALYAERPEGIAEAQTIEGPNLAYVQRAWGLAEELRQSRNDDPSPFDVTVDRIGQTAGRVLDSAPAVDRPALHDLLQALEAVSKIPVLRPPSR